MKQTDCENKRVIRLGLIIVAALSAALLVSACSGNWAHCPPPGDNCYVNANEHEPSDAGEPDGDDDAAGDDPIY